MKSAKIYATLTSLMLSFGGVLVGCDGGKPEGDLPSAEKRMTKEESDKVAAQVKEGMKGGYKGAPGAPVPPGGAAPAK